MKTLLTVLLCLSLPLIGADKKPLTKEESAKVIEAAIRKVAKKPAGELTKADLEKVTELSLSDNPSLSKVQIDELQKALPKCNILHNAKK